MWPTSGRIGFMTLVVWGVRNALEQGKQLEVAQKWVHWLHNPSHVGGGGGGNGSPWGTISELPNNWADWLHDLCRVGGPQLFRATDKLRSGPQVGGLPT